jgi:hypothetical protein
MCSRLSICLPLGRKDYGLSVNFIPGGKCYLLRTLGFPHPPWHPPLDGDVVATPPLTFLVVLVVLQPLVQPRGAATGSIKATSSMSANVETAKIKNINLRSAIESSRRENESQVLPCLVNFQFKPSVLWRH